MIASVLLMLWLGVSGAQERADAWRGRPLDDLIRAWGPPTAMATLSDGSKMADWTHESASRPYSWNYGNGHVSTFQHRYECRVRITTDVKGMITAGKVEGNFAGCNRLFRDKEAPQA